MEGSLYLARPVHAERRGRRVEEKERRGGGVCVCGRVGGVAVVLGGWVGEGKKTIEAGCDHPPLFRKGQVKLV